MKNILYLLSLLIMTSCVSVDDPVTIGQNDYHVLKSPGFFTPSMKALIKEYPNMTTDEVAVAADPGLALALVDAAGRIGAAAALRPDETNIKINGGNSSAKASASGGGSSPRSSKTSGRAAGSSGNNGNGGNNGNNGGGNNGNGPGTNSSGGGDGTNPGGGGNSGGFNNPGGGN